MKNRIVTILLYISLGISLGISLELTSVIAEARSSFSPMEIEKAITDFYRFYPNAEEAEENDENFGKVELAEALAEHIALLSPNAFNDVLGHLIAEYWHNPNNRAAIELLSDQLYRQIAEELRRTQEHQTVFTVIDDVLLVWATIYSFRWGNQGIKAWASRGHGLKTLAPFRQTVEQVVARIPKQLRGKLALTGLGTSAGIAQEIYYQLETKRLNPRKLLRDTQSAILLDLATQAARLRNELRAKQPQNLESSPPDDRALVTQLINRHTQLVKQLQHLHSNAKYLRPKMMPILEDLKESEELLSTIKTSQDPLFLPY